MHDGKALGVRFAKITVEGGVRGKIYAIGMLVWENHSALRAQVRRRRLRDCCRSKTLGAATMAAFIRLLMRNDGAAGRFDLRF